MWKKILLGIVIVIVLAVGLALYATKGLSEIADKQLAALRSGDVATAYAYTSGDFRSSTSLVDFKKFLDRYPSLKNNKDASWGEREISGSTGMLRGTLTANDGTTTPVEFHFVKENDVWKVLTILVLKTGVQVEKMQSKLMSTIAKPAEVKHTVVKPVVSATTIVAPKQIAGDITLGKIYQVLVSDELGSDGNVDQTKGAISRTASKIYVSVYVLHAKKGLEITGILEAAASGSKLGPAKATISQDGNIVGSFTFTKDTPVWPKGAYKITVNTSNNQLAVVNFKIE